MHDACDAVSLSLYSLSSLISSILSARLLVFALRLSYQIPVLQYSNYNTPTYSDRCWIVDISLSR